MVTFKGLHTAKQYKIVLWNIKKNREKSSEKKSTQGKDLQRTRLDEKGDDRTCGRWSWSFLFERKLE